MSSPEAGIKSILRNFIYERRSYRILRVLFSLEFPFSARHQCPLCNSSATMATTAGTHYNSFSIFSVWILIQIQNYIYKNTKRSGLRVPEGLVHGSFFFPAFHLEPSLTFLQFVLL